MFNTQGKGIRIMNNTKFRFDILQELFRNEKHSSVIITHLARTHTTKYAEKCIGPKKVSKNIKISLN